MGVEKAGPFLLIPVERGRGLAWTQASRGHIRVLRTLPSSSGMFS